MHRENVPEFCKDTHEFCVGDTVQVVPEPNYDCPFTWMSHMSGYCGIVTKITKKRYIDSEAEFQYRIEADRGRWAWCGNCFLPIIETPDIDITDEEFDKILMIAKSDA